MKAVIENGKIFNFVPDNYIAGNKEIDGGTHPSIKILPIKGFGFERAEKDDVELNKTREKGVFKYYLDEQGICQQLKVEEQPEYVEYQKRQRASEYAKTTDPIKMKADELLFDGDEAGYTAKMVEWKQAKEATRQKYPY